MRQRVLAILGIAVAVLAVYTFVFRTRPDGPRILAAPGVRLSAAAAGATGASGSAAVPASGLEADSAKAAPTAAAKPPEPIEWGSDPFVRDFLLVNELASFKLRAITIGGDKASVLINDQILEEGDAIGGKRIVAIDPDRVTLEQGGRTFVLILGE